MLSVSYGLGYWLALLSNLFAAMLNFLLSKATITTVQERGGGEPGVAGTVSPSQ